MEERQRYTLARPVCFIGFMGAGKTTLARRLARDCGLASVDTDRALERRHGRDAKDLFYELGEERFRELEADEVDAYTQGEPLLVSCGGGLPAGERSRKLIAERAFCVYVYVSADESASRISNHGSRPYFENMRSVREVNRLRVPMYEELADAVVDSTGKSAHDMAREVKSLLIKEGVLCPQQR